MDTQPRGARRLLAAGAAAILAVGMLAGGSPVLAAGQVSVGLGSAATFAVLAGKPGVTNSGSTVIGGNLGVHPGSRVTGFPPGLVNGETHPGDAAAQGAKVDLVAAYDAAAGRTPRRAKGAW
jgi:type VI secretion system secreted protein VgrG